MNSNAGLHVKASNHLPDPSIQATADKFSDLLAVTLVQCCLPACPYNFKSYLSNALYHDHHYATALTALA